MIRDPEITFFTGYGVWVPIASEMPAMQVMGRTMGGYREFAWLTENNTAIEKFQRYWMDDTGTFVNGMWLTNLRAQGFGKSNTARHNQPPTVSLESLQKELVQVRAAVLYRATQGAFIDAEDVCESGRVFAERLADLAVRTHRMEEK